GDGALVEASLAIANTSDGYTAGAATVARGCVARHNHRDGIVVGDMSAVRECELIRNDGVAIRAGVESVVTENRCVTSSPERSILVGAASVTRENFVPGAVQGAA